MVSMSMRCVVTVALGLILTATGPAAAAPTSKPRSPTKATEPGPTRPPQTGGGEDAGCAKTRKRLWVQGEGWVVRRVTTCR